MLFGYIGFASCVQVRTYLELLNPATHAHIIVIRRFICMNTDCAIAVSIQEF